MSQPSEIIWRMDVARLTRAALAHFLEVRPKAINAFPEQKLKEHEAKGTSEPLVVHLAAKRTFSQIHGVTSSVRVTAYLVGNPGAEP